MKNVPCGTSGGVMIYFDRVEVVNILDASDGQWVYTVCMCQAINSVHSMLYMNMSCIPLNTQHLQNGKFCSFQYI